MTQTPSPPPFSEELSGPVESLMSYILNKYASGLAPLRVPASPDWIIEPYLQERMPVWEALSRFAGMIGWDLRWRWLPGSRTTGQLTFFEPGRANTSTVLNLFTSHYYELTTFETSLEEIRNRVVVGYGPPEARAYEMAESQESINRYRYPRTMWIEEGSNSPLQTAAEALRLATNALADLSTPMPEASVKMPFYPYLELHDLIRVEGNRQHNEPLVFTVVGITHSFADGKAYTELKLAEGRSKLGHRSWLRREFRQGVKYL